MNTIRLLLADDHQIIKDGLRRLLGGIPNMEIVSDVTNGMYALSEVERTQPNLIITDLSMPGLDGFELIDLINARFPEVKIIVLTMHKERAYVQRAIDLKVNGYLLKDISIDELVGAINTVMSGDFYFCEEISKVIVDKIAQKKHFHGSSDAIFQLTTREKEILKLIVDGLKSVDIANRLSISARTVQNHRAHMMKKVGVKNTAELVKLAIKNGLF